VEDDMKYLVIVFTVVLSNLLMAQNSTDEIEQLIQKAQTSNTYSLTINYYRYLDGINKWYLQKLYKSFDAKVMFKSPDNMYLAHNIGKSESVSSIKNVKVTLNNMFVQIEYQYKGSVHDEDQMYLIPFSKLALVDLTDTDLTIVFDR